MCFSAQVQESYALYVRHHGADITFHEFVDLYIRRSEDRRIRIPKGIDANFTNPASEVERAIKILIDEYNRSELARLEQELFKQRKRLADAERKLRLKSTKTALESQRIATDKVQALLGRVAEIKRTSPMPRDSRIFPGSYSLLMVADKGRRTVKPMRYQCRPAGKPAFYDAKYPGTYNARRDNLEGFWKGQFGYSHGIMVVQRFFENVERIGEDGKPCNVVLEFAPADGSEMLVACLWSRWQGTGEPDLLSFAAITDEPPPEVAAAGHDRCIVPIKPENIDAWLNPDPANLDALYRILDDRPRPYYEHRLAA